MNVENLEKLAAYLEALPADYGHFSMARYYVVNESSRLPYELPDAMSCGTVACAAGHGPAAGIPIDGKEWWSDYCQRVFDLGLAEWQWCFASDWVDVDDTHHGAAKRIRYFLAEGLPTDWYAQMIGGAPYIFAEKNV